jgi:hypothetical protein
MRDKEKKMIGMGITHYYHLKTIVKYTEKKLSPMPRCRRNPDESTSTSEPPIE